MAINGYQFDGMRVPPLADAALFSYLGGNKDGKTSTSGLAGGYGDDLKLTVSGLKLTVGTGRAVLDGRLVEITAPITLTVPANYNGYLCFSINLSKSNTATGDPYGSTYTLVNNQLMVQLLTAPVVSANINAGIVSAKDYELAKVTSNTSLATVTPTDFYKTTTGGGSTGSKALTQAVIPYTYFNENYNDTSIFTTGALSPGQSWANGTYVQLTRVGSLVTAAFAAKFSIGTSSQSISFNIKIPSGFLPSVEWSINFPLTTQLGAAQYADGTCYSSLSGTCYTSSPDSFETGGTVTYKTKDPYPSDNLVDNQALASMGLTWPM